MLVNPMHPHAGMERILMRNPAYDVRPLLDGVAPLLHALMRRMRLDASYLLHGLQPLPCTPADRQQASSALAEAVAVSGGSPCRCACVYLCLYGRSLSGEGKGVSRTALTLSLA